MERRSSPGCGTADVRRALLKDPGYSLADHAGGGVSPAGASEDAPASTRDRRGRGVRGCRRAGERGGGQACADCRRLEPAEVIVRFAPDVDARERAATVGERFARMQRTLPRGMAVVGLAPGDSVARAARALEREPDILDATPNFRREPVSN